MAIKGLEYNQWGGRPASGKNAGQPLNAFENIKAQNAQDAQEALLRKQKNGPVKPEDRAC